MRALAYFVKPQLLGFVAAGFLCLQILTAQPTTAAEITGPAGSSISKMKEGVRMIDLAIISQLESSNNPKAFNWKSKATGLFQLTPVALQDYNVCNPRNKPAYTMNDMWDGRKNRIVAVWFFEQRIPQLLKHYGYEPTTDRILFTWHAGIGNVIKNNMGPATHEFIQSYKDKMRELQNGRFSDAKSI